MEAIGRGPPVVVHRPKPADSGVVGALHVPVKPARAARVFAGFHDLDAGKLPLDKFGRAIVRGVVYHRNMVNGPRLASQGAKASAQKPGTPKYHDNGENARMRWDKGRVGKRRVVYSDGKSLHFTAFVWIEA